MSARAASFAPKFALAVPVLAGLGWMASAGAPSGYLIMNTAALALALACACWLPMPQSKGAVTALAATLLGLLWLTALFGIEVDGAHRWIGLGPLRLHTGYLVLPLLVACADRLSSRAAALIVSAAAVATVVQPDRATCFALAAAASTIALARRDWPSVGALTVTLVCAAAALRIPDHLLTVEFVEAVQTDALAVRPLIGFALVLATLAPAALLIGRNRSALPVASFVIVAGLCALAGPYPSILIGYGAAPILGFGMALAALRAK